MEEGEERGEGLREIVSEGLEPLNRRVLEALVGLLRGVCEGSERTKMGASNLALVWAPNLFWQEAKDASQILVESEKEARVFEMLIELLDIEE